MRTLLLAVALAPTLIITMDLPPEDSVKPVKVAEVPGYCEGIVFDRAGIGYISDTQHGTIYAVTPEGRTSIWAKTDAPNGHKVLADGSHLIRDKAAVLHLDSKGKRLDDASNVCDGKPLRAPNDLT